MKASIKVTEYPLNIPGQTRLFKQTLQDGAELGQPSWSKDAFELEL